MLAHVFEQAGLATVSLSSVRGQAERVHAPRMLHCEFPLGRPLGRPGDAKFQRGVLRAAFEMLEAPAGPVLLDYPEVIVDEQAEQLSCPLPPRHDGDSHPAVEEARGLRAAFERAGENTLRSGFGKKLTADTVPDAVAAFVRIADGTPFEDADVPGGDLLAAGHDLRCYYELAAMQLADHVPAARQTENWIYRQTETGKVIRAAAAAMKEAGVAQPLWFYLLPASQAG